MIVRFANVFPSDSDARVLLAESSPHSLEILCRARAKSADGLRWTIGRGDAEDLVRWWRAEDIRVKNGQCPIRDKPCGNVLVSMFSASVIHVRVRDRFGNVKVVGYCFPRAVMEELDRWLSERATHTPVACHAG